MKWGLTIWNYIKFINISENATSFTEYEDTCTQQRTWKYTTACKSYIIHFFYTSTVLNSSRARTLFFVLEFLDVLPNKKIHNHPRKTRRSGEKPWWLRVRIPKTLGATLCDRIIYIILIYGIPYLPKNRKVEILQKNPQNKKKFHLMLKKKIVDHPKIESTDCARQIYHLLWTNCST